MTKTKKILTIVLALAMVFALSCTAFAGTIRITNANGGQTYNAYKVFDLATTTLSGETVTYYTYDGSNAAFLTAIQNSPIFDVSANSNNSYNVYLHSGYSADDVAAFLKTNVANLGQPVATATPTSDTIVTLNVTDPGYYYIDSSLGSVVTLDTYNSNIEVLDKNEKPGPVPSSNPEDPQNPDTTPNYKYIIDKNSKEVTSTSYDAGTVVTFKLTCKATHYDGDTKITEYVVHDIPCAGLTDLQLPAMSNGQPLAYVYTPEGTRVPIPAATMSASTAGGETTVTINWVNATNGQFLYPDNSTIEIFGTAKMLGTWNQDYTNRGFFTWTGSPAAPDPQDPDAPVPTDASIHTSDVSIVAQDAIDNDIKLAGEYVIKNSDNKYYVCDPVTKDVSWTENKNDATVIATDPNDPAAGKVTGLADGTYSIEEKTTPSGYNPLDAAQTVSVNNADVTSTINYNRGTALPATGALGTAMLIGIGSLVVIGAGLFLVTNMRMKKEDILG